MNSVPMVMMQALQLNKRSPEFHLGHPATKSAVCQVVLACACTCALISCSTTATAWKIQGSYLSPGQICNAELKVSPQGGFLQLFVQVGAEEPVYIADDVTGIVWIDAYSLVFSSSPIYGKPGVFKVECDPDAGRPRLTTLVGPRNTNPAYPDGVDYFELRGIKGDNIEFYYCADVDSIDFREFSSEKYLHSVELPADDK